VIKLDSALNIIFNKGLSDTVGCSVNMDVRSFGNNVMLTAHHCFNQPKTLLIKCDTSLQNFCHSIPYSITSFSDSISLGDTTYSFVAHNIGYLPMSYSLISHNFNWTDSCENVFSGVNNIEVVTSTIFPNPTFNSFSIKGDFQFESVELLDLSGKIVKIIKPILKSQIDISGCPSGVYIVRLSSKNSQRFLHLIKM
jgi:hypothetical protein